MEEVLEQCHSLLTEYKILLEKNGDYPEADFVDEVINSIEQHIDL